MFCAVQKHDLDHVVPNYDTNYTQLQAAEKQAKLLALEGFPACYDNKIATNRQRTGSATTKASFKDSEPSTECVLVSRSPDISRDVVTTFATPIKKQKSCLCGGHKNSACSRL